MLDQTTSVLKRVSVCSFHPTVDVRFEKNIEKSEIGKSLFLVPKIAQKCDKIICFCCKITLRATNCY